MARTGEEPWEVGESHCKISRFSDLVHMGALELLRVSKCRQKMKEQRHSGFSIQQGSRGQRRVKEITPQPGPLGSSHRGHSREGGGGILGSVVRRRIRGPAWTPFPLELRGGGGAGRGSGPRPGRPGAGAVERCRGGGGGCASVRPGLGHVCVRTPQPSPSPLRLAHRNVHHGLHPESPHRGRGGHRHSGQLGLSLPSEVR